MVEMLFWTTVKIFAAVSLVLYLRLVAMTYRTEGPAFHFRVTLADPIRSAKRLLVWLGVKAEAALLRIGTATLDALFEASAEVGEWYVHQRGLDITLSDSASPTKPSFFLIPRVNIKKDAVARGRSSAPRHENLTPPNLLSR
jgi:hypothetical protein